MTFQVIYEQQKKINGQSDSGVEFTQETPSHQMVQGWANQASRAPSADNMQPWKITYRAEEGVLVLGLGDLTQAMPAEIDPNFAASYIALGGVAQNLRLLAQRDGFAVRWIKATNPSEQSVQFEIKLVKSAVENNGLVTWISKRNTNRLPFKAESLSGLHVEALKSLQAELPFTTLSYRTQKESHHVVRAMTFLDSLRYNNGRLFKSFVKTLRFGQETYRTRDGLAGPTLGVPLVLRLGLVLMKKLSFTWRTNILGSQQFSTYWGVTRLFKKSAGTIALQGTQDTPQGWFLLGFDLQRLWLNLNSMGIAVQPFGATLLLYRAQLEKSAQLKNLSVLFGDKKRKQLLNISENLKKNENIEASKPLLVLRVGYPVRALKDDEISMRKNAQITVELGAPSKETTPSLENIER